MFLAIFDVLPAELLKIQDFRDATLCRTVSRIRRFLYFQYAIALHAQGCCSSILSNALAYFSVIGYSRTQQGFYSKWIL